MLWLCSLSRFRQMLGWVSSRHVIRGGRILPQYVTSVTGLLPLWHIWGCWGLLHAAHIWYGSHPGGVSALVGTNV